MANQPDFEPDCFSAFTLVKTCAGYGNRKAFGHLHHGKKVSKSRPDKWVGMEVDCVPVKFGGQRLGRAVFRLASSLKRVTRECDITRLIIAVRDEVDESLASDGQRKSRVE